MRFEQFIPIMKKVLDSKQVTAYNQSMASLHNIYCLNSSVEVKSPSGVVVNQICLARRASSLEGLGFLFL